MQANEEQPTIDPLDLSRRKPFSRRLETLLTVSFSLFLFCSAFTIAGAQIALGWSTLLLVSLLLVERRFPAAQGLRPLWWALGIYVSWLVISAVAGPSPLSSLAALREEWLLGAGGRRSAGRPLRGYSALHRGTLVQGTRSPHCER